MQWQVMLITYDDKTQTATFLIQTDINTLYPIKIIGHDNTRNAIAKRISEIAKIPNERVRFTGEKRRRDKHTILNYMVMHNDDMPPF